ncbi:FKBP-type peptidyl-prolyl cis-trans isomerases 2 [Moorella thermoacetica Y72]|uniref:FKBP-type peptidyl-prolyl cis-trans isomerases 2 n=1 Tax=Moorella thermoacetica Y72 TaxID=1325331 RepID=A0A0S6U875_NEOTH|nr:FKBP-type peptidyl-prolyl cis-trans isomerases 2 [Moorella thermoacetica Y72]
MLSRRHAPPKRIPRISNNHRACQKVTFFKLNTSGIVIEPLEQTGYGEKEDHQEG